ncbi:MAG: hypothetical protein J7605_02425 [Variovorax sp.]|nr:hypothetical protein [Variovorax sp.]
MNLDKQGPAPSADLAAPGEWTMEITHQANQYIATLACRNIVMCRISLARSDAADEAAARTALADKSRRWVRDYLARLPTA